MARGWGTARANANIDALDGAWMQLHTGDPGPNGTANVASNSTRKQISLNPASAGSATNDADIEWLGVPTAEDYTDFTLWSLVTAGTFDGSGTITANPVGVADDFVIASGSLTLSNPVAS